MCVLIFLVQLITAQTEAAGKENTGMTVKVKLAGHEAGDSI